MRKRKNTPQVDAAPEPTASGAPRNDVETISSDRPAPDIPTLAAPAFADAGNPPATNVAPAPVAQAPAAASADPQLRKEPVMPRAATLDTPRTSPPRVEIPHPAPPQMATLAGARAQPRRFALLAACVALSAGVGAIGGSLASIELGHVLTPPAPAHAEAADEIRALKDSVAHLRASVKTIGDNVAAVRAGLNASFSSTTAQFTKVNEALEKLERQATERQAAERHAAATQPAAPETTASIAAPAAAANKSEKPGVIDGWVLRKAYRGAALVEGRYGIIEVEPGDYLPGVGRVDEIKRQDGRWVIVTARGLIVGAQ